MKRKFVVVDFETTGNSPKKGDRIIQIGAAVIEAGVIIDTYSSFINPEMKIPAFIQQFTGINDEMVCTAPLFQQIVPELMERLNGAYFVAHNAVFDLSFLQHELDTCGYDSFRGPVIDTVELARLVLPTEDSFKLQDLARNFQLSHDRPHQADSDALVTAELFLLLLSKLEKLPLLTLQRLKTIISKLNPALEIIIQDCINDKLTKSIAVDPVYDEYRQLVLRKTEEIIALDSVEEIPLFKEDLPHIHQRLSNLMEGFEIRHGQKEMMETIDASLLSNQHLLIEAGTGTGKSLAYVLPGLYFAKRTNVPLVISTHTVQLQQQLIERDMAIAKNAVSFPFRSAVLKGRTHYLCLRKFDHKLAEVNEDNFDLLLTKGQILIWLTDTTNGDVEQLNLPSGGRSFWGEVQSDSITCIGKHCPWFSRCFYHRARNLAYGADLVITNHALLFTDITQEHQILPSYKQVIVDEAHHLEDIVSDHFGIQTDYLSFHYLFVRIGSLQGNELLQQLFILQEELGLNLEDDFHQLEGFISKAKVELDECFRIIYAISLKRLTPAKNELGRRSLRYFPQQFSVPNSREVQEATLRVQQVLQDVKKRMKKIIDEILQRDDQLTFAQNGTLTTFKGILANVIEEKGNLEELLLNYDPNYVYWIEIEPKGAKNAVHLYRRPIEVDEIVAEHFFSKKLSVVMTSATLTVKNSFQYIIQRLGLTDFGVVTKVIESPFQFDNQVQVMIPTTLPNIKAVNESDYIYEVVISILDIAKITKGRMLVLFTSNDMLRKSYYQLKDFIENEQFILIAQGISSGSRAKLTKNFKQFEQAILFGTSSFWEGVDIPGEDLSCLVIVRLPFSPPDNPIFEARSEKLKELGKNPFMELSLPQAIIRFKQGFGRLIRSTKDRGAVFIFDRRIVETRYGKSFIQSLPKVPLKENSLKQLLYELENWL